MKELKKDTKEIIFELIRLNAPRGVQVELKENTTFFGDLKYDSLALISLLADVEEEFQLEFDDMEESLEAFEKAADGKATKIIIPSEIQGMAGLAKSVKEVMKDE